MIGLFEVGGFMVAVIATFAMVMGLMYITTPSMREVIKQDLMR